MSEAARTESAAAAGGPERSAPGPASPAPLQPDILALAAMPRGVGPGPERRGAALAVLQRRAGNRQVARAVAALTRAPGAVLQRACEIGQGLPPAEQNKSTSDLVFSVTLRAATSGYDGVTFTITNKDCQALLGYKMQGEPSGKARWTADNLVDELKVGLKWAFERPGVHRLEITPNAKGELAFTTYELEKELANDPNVVVVIGSPSPDQKHKLQFVTAALMEKGDALWFVERTGYEAAGVSLDEIKGKAPGGRVRWITPEKGLVDAINGLPNGSVRRMVVYSHGVQGQVTLRYGWEDKGKPNYGLNRDQARKIDGNVFTSSAVIDLESCQGGTKLEGGSLAQVIADKTDRDVVGWTGRTSYADVNAGRGGVRGSEYGFNTDAAKEFWTRNFVADDTPRRVTFKPAVARLTRSSAG
jgi:hypothetical protein